MALIAPLVNVLRSTGRVLTPVTLSPDTDTTRELNGLLALQ